MSDYTDFVNQLVNAKLPTNPTFFGNRAEDVEVLLLDNNENVIGPLRVKSMKIHSSVQDTIRSGGTMTVLNPDQVPGGWLNKKIKVTYKFRSKTAVQGLVEGRSEAENVFTYTESLGIFIPSSPSGSRGRVGTPRDVELYDKLLILAQDMVATSYTVAKGTVVTTKVIQLIQSAGGGNHIKIPASTETLRASLVFEAGTTKLQIVNRLLSAINYWALWCDGDGWFRSSKYVEPTKRGVSPYVLDEGENAIYLEGFGDDEDTFDIPNKVICVARSANDQYTYTAIATNTDPNNPFSYPNRGNRWVTMFVSDVEASSATVLGDIAKRKLIDASANIRTYDVQHALLPYLLNDVVIFDNPSNNINGHHCVVEKTELTLDLPGVMMTSTIREIGWTG